MKDLTRRMALTRFASAFAGAMVAPRIRLEAIELPGGGGPQDETYWRHVRGAFDLTDGVTNLDNAYACPAPRAAMNDLVRYIRYAEQLPARHFDELFFDTNLKVVVPRIARLLGVAGDEIALVRNATEALDTVLLGVPLTAGDEVVCSAHDFFAMLDALEQRRAREGIVLRMIHPPLRASLGDLAHLYEAAITRRTRLVLVMHASNVTGQLYPVRRIAAAAHAVGAEVVVDAAQTLALLPHTIADLECDYYGASLHKWLLAPVGSGVLWIRKPLADKVWPLFPPKAGLVGMLRFMWFGTSPDPLAAAVTAAIDLHEKIGSERKAERLRYLTAYWRQKVERLPGVQFYTTRDPEASCGLAVFEMAGIDSEKLCDHLWEKHRIVVQAVGTKGRTTRAPEIRGVRVTPNVYTSVAELDRFVAAIERVAEHGLSASA